MRYSQARHQRAEPGSDGARRLLQPAGRLVIGSMCGLPRYAEDLATYDPARHHLLKEGQPWRTLKPLPALLNEIQQAQFTVLATNVKHNAWWDHATIVCSANGPSADPQES